MPLKVEGDPGYGSMVGPGLSLLGSLGGSETLPLLIPADAEPDLKTWKPMTREQLEAAAGGPGWKKFRSRLVLLFWLAWLTMLVVAVVVIIQSPRPVATPLHWWQKELFYRLQPVLLLDVEILLSHDESISILGLLTMEDWCRQDLSLEKAARQLYHSIAAKPKVSDRLSYFKSLGVGVLILEGLFRRTAYPINLTEIDQQLGTSLQFHQLITDSNKAGVRVIIDLCDLDLLSVPQLSNKTENLADASGNVQDSLRYWLEEGVSGFAICDTDPTFTEQTLTEWRGLVEEFNTEYNERIVMVKELDDSSQELSMTKPTVNSSLVHLVLKSLLPQTTYPLSAAELSEVMETKLKTVQGEGSSWTVNGQVAWELQNALMVLMMTLPGTPVIRYGDEVSPSVNIYANESADGQDYKATTTVKNQLQSQRSTVLFQSLSRTRFREETLLYGTYTFLPFNNSSHSNSTGTPIQTLAFLRSWGCLHFLVLLNLGSEPHSLDPDWATSLPEEGVYVTSTGLDRLGAVFFHTVKLQPHEAIVIKLFESGNKS